jgi:hypothetical protein
VQTEESLDFFSEVVRLLKSPKSFFLVSLMVSCPEKALIADCSSKLMVVVKEIILA